MTTGKKASTGKGKVKKLSLAKETLKDLRVKRSAVVKGGMAAVSGSDTECMISCYQQCRTRGVDCNSKRGC